MITYDEIKKLGRNIRLHGNRFIQIDLDDDGARRINVWADSVPMAQKVPTPIHDHVFDYQSTVISGALLNAEYSIFHDMGDKFHRVYTCSPYRVHQGVRCDRQDTQLEPIDDRVSYACIDRVTHYGRGNSYQWPAGWFHATAYIGHAITLMERGSTVLARAPRVLVPEGREPDNEFNRYQCTESYLWSIVGLLAHDAMR